MSKETIQLQTNEGVESLDIDITFDNKDPNKALLMTIKAHYQGKQITAFGNRYPFEDAFADLQKKLPENVILSSCMTCRHGNMCPSGDESNRVFCTKDVTIRSIRDLHFYTEDVQEHAKRSRRFTDYCADYQQQAREHFTYNDYLHYLNQ